MSDAASVQAPRGGGAQSHTPPEPSAANVQPRPGAGLLSASRERAGRLPKLHRLSASQVLKSRFPQRAPFLSKKKPGHLPTARPRPRPRPRLSLTLVPSAPWPPAAPGATVILPSPMPWSSCPLGRPSSPSASVHTAGRPEPLAPPAHPARSPRPPPAPGPRPPRSHRVRSRLSRHVPCSASLRRHRAPEPSRACGSDTPGSSWRPHDGGLALSWRPELGTPAARPHAGVGSCRGAAPGLAFTAAGPPG